MISPLQAWIYAIMAGFTPAQADTATCVAKYESGFRPKIVNNNRNKTKDYGLMQINDFWLKKGRTPNCRDLDLLDPADSMKCAQRIVSDERGRFTAWVAYKKHRKTCDAYRVCPKADISPGTPAQTILNVRKTCARVYNDCLFSLKRTGPQSYHAICGGRRPAK